MNTEKYFFLCFILSLKLSSVIHKIQKFDDRSIWSAYLTAESDIELLNKLCEIDIKIEYLEIQTAYFKGFVYSKCSDGQTVWKKFCKSLDKFKKLEYLGFRSENFYGFRKTNDIKALTQAISFINPKVSIVISSYNKPKAISTNEALTVFYSALKRCNFSFYKDGIWHKDIEMRNKDAVEMDFKKIDKLSTALEQETKSPETI